MSYTTHLYQILHPNTALVASHLAPEDFARHYQIGSTRYYRGRLVFAEIDPAFRHPFFPIDRLLENLVPHEDGSPKATKFISSYRVLEHMDLDAIQKLYIANPDGYALELSESPYDKTHEPGFIRTYAEITPLSLLVLSNWEMPEFARFITDPDNPKGAPKLFFTQIDLDVDLFLETFEQNPMMPPPLPTVHPSRLRDAILDLRRRTGKGTKGVSLSSDFEHISMRRVRHGFMFASHEKTKFFEMPTPAEIEKTNLRFYRSMD